MNDAVIDTAVVSLANADLSNKPLTGKFKSRLEKIELCIKKKSRLRINDKLRTEYLDHLSNIRNDYVALFIQMLDTDSVVKARRSTLSRQDHQTATSCRWPSHDQHLLAAAIGGNRVKLWVHESAHTQCAACIRRRFSVRVEEA